MNTNWAKILLFSLLSFALGIVICCLVCHQCGGHGNCHGGGCGKEMSCHGEGDAAACSHHGGGEKAACCKGGGHGMHGDENVHVIVKELEGSNFQGDTTITIDGGTVNVHRMGDSTSVKVEMKKEEVLEHAH